MSETCKMTVSTDGSQATLDQDSLCQQTQGIGKQGPCGTTLKEAMNQLSLCNGTLSTELRSRVPGIGRSFALDQISLFPEIRYMASRSKSS